MKSEICENCGYAGCKLCKKCKYPECLHNHKFVPLDMCQEKKLR